MGKLARSFELVKASFAVLRADKELVIFPILSTIALILVSIAFLAPMLVVGLVEDMVNGGAGQILGYAVLFVYYLVTYTIVIFANTAIVGAAMMRLRGQDPTFQDGVSIATKNFNHILGYAAISAVVGMILRAIEERTSLIGDIVINLIGAAWSIATFLVIPVMVVEGIGPIDAIKRSASLLKKTWGEQIAGNIGIGLIFFLLALVGIVPGVILIVAAAAVSVVLAVLVGIVLGLYLAALMAVGSAVSGIYTAAVYMYATQTAPTNAYFDQELLRSAFTQKHKRSSHTLGI
jgi:hypothetical protein